MKCKLCGKEVDLLSGFFRSPEFKGEWQFECASCPDNRGYDLSVKQFFESPKETIGWLAHLHEKNWFKADKFLDFMDRLRANA